MGAPRVGKTSLVSAATPAAASGKFDFLPDVWANEVTVTISTDHETEELRLNDSSSISDISTLKKNHVHRIKLFGTLLICFAVNNRKSFRHVEHVFYHFLSTRSTAGFILCACKSDLYHEPAFFLRNPDKIKAKVDAEVLKEHKDVIKDALQIRQLGCIQDVLLSFCNWSNLCLIQEHEIRKLCDNLGFHDYILTSAIKKTNIDKCFKLCHQHLNNANIDHERPPRFVRTNSHRLSASFDRLRSESRNRDYSGPERSPRRRQSEIFTNDSKEKRRFHCLCISYFSGD